MAPIVAGYATATVPGQVTAPPPSHPDSDGDGVSDWLDPYPFDPDNGNPPPQPPLPAFSPLAILPGDGPDQLQLLVANSGSDQVLAYTASGRPMGLVAQAVATNPRPLISEHSDLDVDDDGRLVLLANGDVQHPCLHGGQCRLLADLAAFGQQDGQWRDEHHRQAVGRHDAELTLLYASVRSLELL